MSDTIPILEGEPLSAEDKRLIALFDQLETNQIGFLDEAGKRVIELSTLMLGLLLGIAAFGDKFPPAYLAGNTTTKWLVLVTLALYLLALGAGLMAVQPRGYQRYTHNLARLAKELERIASYKTRWFRTATILFGAASLALAALVALLVWNA